MNKIPYRYDIVGSFLRSERLKHARENFNNNLISKNELKKIEKPTVAKNEKKKFSNKINKIIQLTSKSDS